QMPALDRVLRHCLEKRPELRFQSARDLAFALEAASTGTATTVASSPAAVKPAPRLPWRYVAAGIGVIALAGAAFLAGREGRRAGPPEYHRLGLYHSEPLGSGTRRHPFPPHGQTILI